MKQSTFLAALRSGGIQPEDDAELRLKKSLLVFATGLVCLGSMLWVFLYGQMGPQFSVTAPLVFQLLLAGNAAARDAAPAAGQGPAQGPRPG